jgi:hypothetical protein
MHSLADSRCGARTRPALYASRVPGGDSRGRPASLCVAAGTQVRQQAGRCRLKTPRIPVRSRYQHNALERPEKHPRPLLRWFPKYEPPGAEAILKHSGEPALVCVEEQCQPYLHRLRKRRVLRRKHSAQTHPFIAQHGIVKIDIMLQLFVRLLDVLVNLTERSSKKNVVALDQCAPEFRFGRKMIMEACLCNAQPGCNIGIAEAVIPLCLCEPLGHIENGRSGRCRWCGARRRRILSRRYCHGYLRLTY